MRAEVGFGERERCRELDARGTLVAAVQLQADDVLGRGQWVGPGGEGGASAVAQREGVLLARLNT